MQLLAWVLQVPSAYRNCVCGGKNQNRETCTHSGETGTPRSYPATPGVQDSIPTHP